jgi:hypothetical protein
MNGDKNIRRLSWGFAGTNTTLLASKVTEDLVKHI